MTPTSRGRALTGGPAPRGAATSRLHRSACDCRRRRPATPRVSPPVKALEPAEVAAGYILICQTYAVSDTLTVDFDG